MIDLLLSITSIDAYELIAIALIFSRISASLILLPAFGEKAVPTRIKLGLAIILTSLIIPIVRVENELISQVDLSVLLLAEVSVGILIGFFFRCLVFALQICGTIAAQATSLAQSFGAGLGVDPQPAFSTFFVVSGLSLLSLMDWHTQVSKFYATSVVIFPVGQWPLSPRITEAGVNHIAWTFEYGFSLAAPFVIASLIYNLGLGFINKAMPQLMVALVGAPASSFLGLLILFLSGAFILKFWISVLVPQTLDATMFIR